MSSYYKDKIREQITQLHAVACSRTIDGYIVPLMTERAKLAIDSAEQWLANGALCHYPNEDFDVMSSVYCAETELAKAVRLASN